MESEQIVKATFKTKHKKRLDFILQTLRKTFGQKNVNALTPVFMYKARIYILDMDIRIPDPLLHYQNIRKRAELGEEEG